MIEAEKVTIRVGTFAVQDVNFNVPTGKYCVLMGKTGSGKTTLLEAICGLKRVAAGKIVLAEREVTNLKPAQRGIGFVPQEGALFPSMTVRGHLEFAPSIRGWSRQKIEDSVTQLASLLGIEELLGRRTWQLSGGERQRVALGRALSFQPKILCLDEPLSALDDDTRSDMITLLKRVQSETGVTALHVTHNVSEAEQLADILLRIDNGVVNMVEANGAANSRRNGK